MAVPLQGESNFLVDSTGKWYRNEVTGTGSQAASPLDLGLELPPSGKAEIGDRWSFTSVVQSGHQVRFQRYLDATATLDSVGSEEGRSIAFISVTGQYRWEGNGAFKASGEEELHATVRWNLDGGYPLEILGETKGFGNPPPDSTGQVSREETRSKSRIRFRRASQAGSFPTP